MRTISFLQGELVWWCKNNTFRWRVKWKDPTIF